MNFKDFFIKHKKLIITVLSSIILGTGIGIISSPSEAEYTYYLTKNTELLSKIATVNAYIKTNEISIEELTNKKSALQFEKDKITEEKQKATEGSKQTAAIESVNKSKAEEESVQVEEKAKMDQESKLQETKKSKTYEDVDVHTKRNTEAQSNIQSNSTSNSKKSISDNSVRDPVGQIVWQTETGKKYHSNNHCWKTNPLNASKISLNDAKAQGLCPCSKCF